MISGCYSSFRIFHILGFGLLFYQMAIKGGIGLFLLLVTFFTLQIYIEVLLLGYLSVISCCTIGIHRILVAHSNVSSTKFSLGFAGHLRQHSCRLSGLGSQLQSILNVSFWALVQRGSVYLGLLFSTWRLETFRNTNGNTHYLLKHLLRAGSLALLFTFCWPSNSPPWTSASSVGYRNVFLYGGGWQQLRSRDLLNKELIYMCLQLKNLYDLVGLTLL